MIGCVNCGRPKVNRPRGMCWSCYYRPGVRDRFPITSKYAPGAGVGHECDGIGTMPTPTAARPCTPEKVAVLEGRARRGEQLFHPADAKW